MIARKSRRIIFRGRSIKRAPREVTGPLRDSYDGLTAKTTARKPMFFYVASEEILLGE